MNAQNIFRGWLALGLIFNGLASGAQTLFGPAWLWLVLMPLVGCLSCTAPLWGSRMHRHGPQAVRVRRRTPSH